MRSMIAAMGKNRVIARDGQLPWHLPDDLRWFKQKTMGHAVIMGRKTYDTLGSPLPGRRTIVLSRSLPKAPAGCELARTLDEAFALCADDAEPFVVGGGEIYRLALPAIDRVYLTVVDDEPPGQVSFPDLGREWQLVWRQAHPPDDRHASGFEFQIYERKTD